MIYRRDIRNRSLDDFSETRPRPAARAGKRTERSARPDVSPALKSAPAALAAVPALK